MTETKRCGRCGETLPLAAFHRNSARGRQAYCRDCANAYRREWVRRPHVINGKATS